MAQSQDIETQKKQRDNMTMFPIIICFLVLFFCIGVYWIAPRLYGTCLQFWLERKAIKEKKLLLTFDDGPGQKLTPRILQILEEHNVKATFFLLGKSMVGKECLVKQIELQGHQIASHGYGHLNHWKVSPLAAIRDIQKGWQAIDDARGTKQGKYPFRPPYGKLNIVSLIYLLFKKVPIYYWTVVSGDTWPDGKRNVQHAGSILKTKNGGVTLAHDFDRNDDHVDRFVIESLKQTIAMAKENNMKITTFAELYAQ